MQNNYSNVGVSRGSCRASGGIGQEIVYAGFWVRLAAYMIDSVIVFAGLLIVRMFLFGMSAMTEGTVLGGNILFHYTLKDIILYGVQVIYFILCTYHAGTTPGKRVMNLRVESAVEGEKLSFLNVVYRETVGRFLSGLVLYIGYIIIGIDKEKRGLHDMLCDTRVVYGKKIKIYPMYQTPPISRGTPVQPDPGSPPMPSGFGTPVQPGAGAPPMPSGFGTPVQPGAGVPPMGASPIQKEYPQNMTGMGRPPVQKKYPPNLSGAGTGIFDQPFQHTSEKAPEVPRMPEGGYRMVDPEAEGKTEGHPANAIDQPDENHPEQVDRQEERDS